jgi:hypothetical protein
MSWHTSPKMAQIWLTTAFALLWPAMTLLPLPAFPVGCAGLQNQHRAAKIAVELCAPAWNRLALARASLALASTSTALSTLTPARLALANTTLALAISALR